MSWVRITVWMILLFAILSLMPPAWTVIASSAPTLSTAECRARVEAYEQNPYPVNFAAGQCTYFAMAQRRDLMVLNYYQQTCRGSRLWNGGLWPLRLTERIYDGLTLPEAFRQDMGREWYWTVAESDQPRVGATAHWQNCTMSTPDLGTFTVSTHVAYVVAFDDKTITVLQDNLPFGARNGTQGKMQVINRTDCIRYIYPVEIRYPAPTLEHDVSIPFSIRWPLRWLSVSTLYRFELRLDNNPAIVLAGAGGANREFTTRVFLLPGSHTARIRYWAESNASAPQFTQAPFVFGQVLAAEPDADTRVTIEYGLTATPATAHVGDRVTIAYSAREPVTNQPISAIEVYLNERMVNRSLGSRGTFVWQPSNADVGQSRIRLQARLNGFDAIQSKEYVYTVRAKDTAPPPLPPPQPTVPNPPILDEPRNGATLSSDTQVTLRWNPSTNATEYKVELWGGPYSRMTPCDWQSSTSCRIGTMWPGTMQWRVKARNGGRESDWSDTWSFTVQEAPRPITNTPTPTRTATPVVATDRDLQVIGNLYLSTTSPQVGETVTAIFKLKNVSSHTINITRLVAGARGPSARSLEWRARQVDFPARTNISLQPGWEYEYRESRSFDQPGDYFAEPAWLEAGTSKWEGVWPYPRVWFNVVSRPVTSTPTPTPRPVTPGRLVLVEGLRVSTTNPQVNQSVNARFRVRNDGGLPITARYLGVKGRHSSGASYDFHWIENLTLQAGQEFTYDVNRSFDRAGSYSLTPNYSDGSNWHDIKFANGSSNYVTINVTAPQPPPPGPTGNLARNARREPDGIGSGNAFDGNLSTFWTNGLGHHFNLRLTLAETATVNRIIVWDRPQNSPDNQQINKLIISLSNGWSKRFDMISGGPRCIDVTLSSPQRIAWVNLKADDASGNNGLSEVEIWAGSKTTGISCSNKGSMP